MSEYSRHSLRLVHPGPVWSVAATPDGTRYLSAGDDRTVRVWDAATGNQLPNCTATPIG